MNNIKYWLYPTIVRLMYSLNFLFSLFVVLTAGLVEVIIYSSPDDKKKNRGFCFLEYESHKVCEFTCSFDTLLVQENS